MEGPMRGVIGAGVWRKKSQRGTTFGLLLREHLPNAVVVQYHMLIIDGGSLDIHHTFWN